MIELLIVVAIIAILAAIAVPNFLEAQIRSKVSRLYADYRTCGMALEAYHVDHGTYINPWFNGREEAPMPEPNWTGGWLVLDGGGGKSGVGWQLTTPVAYITSIPDDPFWIDHGIKHYGVPMHHAGPLYWGVLRANNLTWFPPPHTIHSSLHKYFLESCGPDLAQHGFSPAGPGPYYIYDPTNGTVSTGDIWYIQGDGFLGGYEK